MSIPTATRDSSRGHLGNVKRSTFVLAAALLFFSPGSQASPDSSEEVRAQVASLLDEPDAFPPYESRWLPLGPAALTVLEELASNPKAPASQRSRAVTSMAAVDHPQAADHLRALLEGRRNEPPLRASAATALSLRAGQEAIPLLLPFLQDPDQQVRIAVARALGRLGGLQVQQALEDRLPSEQDPLVREALQQGLTLLVP
jgi:hypothetical protein